MLISYALLEACLKLVDEEGDALNGNNDEFSHVDENGKSLVLMIRSDATFKYLTKMTMK